ncbi:hypothetical protein NDU88_003358 [Pleurodeles waltl]|uniref:Uncharacterized protein n=1 Tax=Pleurodeles waltl TaxID=8319 RepID=A0AAV7TNU6_PLEWA|nr:hypothetical protein NDU88_003358 [Pleurodeles waltl]
MEASVQRGAKHSRMEALFEALMRRMGAMDQAIAFFKSQPSVSEEGPSSQLDRPWQAGVLKRGCEQKKGKGDTLGQEEVEVHLVKSLSVMKCLMLSHASELFRVSEALMIRAQ